MKYLDEMFAFVITEKDIFYAFQNSDYKFRDHCEALEYLYNEKINKGFFKKKIHSREKKLYTMIIANSNNILFLNETKGGDVYRAFLYIPEYISESLKKFILKCLVRNEGDRADVDELLKVLLLSLLHS